MLTRIISGLALATLLGLFFAAPASALQTSPGPGSTPIGGQLKSKKCKLKDVGNEGCDITVKIKKDSSDSSGNTFCAEVKIECPAGIPGGDPAETCEYEEVCGLSGSGGVSLEGCDGQDFGVGPKTDKTWSDVWKDCGNLSGSVSK